jgi:predicted nucleotidyltransferase
MVRLFGLLNSELERADASAELYVVGGAVMCLALGARDATRDVDALFKPTNVVREAAARVAVAAGVPNSWLNDAVKAWLSPRGEYDEYLELSHLSAFVAQPNYLLAMKCVAMRLGEEFRDLDDVRYLLRHLNITNAKDALALVTRYFDDSAIPLKTRLALEEILGG